MTVSKEEDDYYYYTNNMVTTEDVCNAIDVFEMSDDPEHKKCAENVIKAGWIQNELRIEKHNPNKKVPRTDEELDDLALKDLFEKDKKLNKVISEAKGIYVEHKKTISISPKQVKRTLV